MIRNRNTQIFICLTVFQLIVLINRDIFPHTRELTFEASYRRHGFQDFCMTQYRCIWGKAMRRRVVIKLIPKAQSQARS